MTKSWAGVQGFVRGCAYDASKERLYVADTGNNRLVSFDKEFSYLSELQMRGFRCLLRF